VARFGPPTAREVVHATPKILVAFRKSYPNAVIEGASKLTGAAVTSVEPRPDGKPVPRKK